MKFIEHEKVQESVEPERVFAERGQPAIVLEGVPHYFWITRNIAWEVSVNNGVTEVRYVREG